MKSRFALIPAVLLLVGCSHEVLDGSRMDILRVDQEASARVVLDEAGHTLWTGGEEVSVFYHNLDNEKWTHVSLFSGDVLTHVHEDRVRTTDRTVALYPYQENAVLEGEALSVELPSVQRLVPGSFGPDAALLTAVSESDRLHFHYAVGLLSLHFQAWGRFDRFVLSGLNGEVLAGPVRIDLADPAAPALSLMPAAGDTSLTLRADAAQEFSGSVELIFCLPPMSFSSGFKLECSFTDGSSKVLRWEEPVSVSRGHVTDCWLAAIYKDEELVLDFTDGNDPFDKDYADTLKALPRYTTAHPDYTFYLKHGSEHYPFTMHAGYYESDGSASYGMGIGAPAATGIPDFQLGRGGSYISIPPMAGKTLYSVSYVAGSTSGKPVLTSDPAGTDPVSTQVGNTEIGGEYTMMAYLTEPGKTYYMCTKAPVNYLHARKITVRYR